MESDGHFGMHEVCLGRGNGTTHMCSSFSCSTSPIFCASCWMVFLNVVYCNCRSGGTVSKAKLVVVRPWKAYLAASLMLPLASPWCIALCENGARRSGFYKNRCWLLWDTQAGIQVRVAMVHGRSGRRGKRAASDLWADGHSVCWATQYLSTLTQKICLASSLT